MQTGGTIDFGQWANMCGWYAFIGDSKNLCIQGANDERMSSHIQQFLMQNPQPPHLDSTQAVQWQNCGKWAMTVYNQMITEGRKIRVALDHWERKLDHWQGYQWAHEDPDDDALIVIPLVDTKPRFGLGKYISMTSTSGDTDSVLPWRMGGDLQRDALIVIPLVDTNPRFGLGKYIRQRLDGTIVFQWMSNSKDSWERKEDTFKPAWKNAKGQLRWGENKPARRPYTSRDTDTKIGKASVMMHGFELTPANTLGAPLRRAIEETTKDWWDWSNLQRDKENLD